jgi:hypothetical protein
MGGSSEVTRLPHLQWPAHMVSSIGDLDGWVGGACGHLDPRSSHTIRHMQSSDDPLRRAPLQYLQVDLDKPPPYSMPAQVSFAGIVSSASVPPLDDGSIYIAQLGGLTRHISARRLWPTVEEAPQTPDRGREIWAGEEEAP